MTQTHTAGQPKSVCRVSLPATTVIRPREERLLWAKVHPPDKSNVEYAGVLEPKEGFENRYQLLVARVVAVPSDKGIPVRVANLSSSQVTLYRGVNVGQFCPLVNQGDDCEDTAYKELPPPSHQDKMERQVLHVQQEPGTRQRAADLLGIDPQGLESSEIEQLDQLVSDFADVFSTSKHDLGRTSWTYHQIDTGQATPVKQTHADFPFIDNRRLEN